jgi:hypothetical protein
MDEGAGRVVAQPVVEDAGDDVDLFRAGLVHVELQEPRPGVDLEELRPGAIRPSPKRPFAHPGVDFLRPDVLAEHMDDFGHAY